LFVQSARYLVNFTKAQSVFRVSDHWLPTAVGSEEARLRAGLRPPLKLHVRISRMQLSQRCSSAR